MTKFYDNRNPKSLASRMRMKRFSIFIKYLKDNIPLNNAIEILDIGGTVSFWTLHYKIFEENGINAKITVLNLPPIEEKIYLAGKIKTIQGDATNLNAISPQKYDVIFSNSVIEHVGIYSMQLAFSTEVKRVSNYYFIQTPYRYFILEPHFIFPFWFLLPKIIKSLLLTYFNLGWYKKSGDYQIAKAEIEQVRLMTKSEFQYAFPKAVILKEKILFFTKSLIAVGGNKI